MAAPNAAVTVGENIPASSKKAVARLARYCAARSWASSTRSSAGIDGSTAACSASARATSIRRGASPASTPANVTPSSARARSATTPWANRAWTNRPRSPRAPAAATAGASGLVVPYMRSTGPRRRVAAPLARNPLTRATPNVAVPGALPPAISARPSAVALPPSACTGSAPVSWRAQRSARAGCLSSPRLTRWPRSNRAVTATWAGSVASVRAVAEQVDGDGDVTGPHRREDPRRLGAGIGGGRHQVAGGGQGFGQLAGGDLRIVGGRPLAQRGQQGRDLGQPVGAAGRSDRWEVGVAGRDDTVAVAVGTGRPEGLADGAHPRGLVGGLGPQVEQRDEQVIAESPEPAGRGRHVGQARGGPPGGAGQRLVDGGVRGGVGGETVGDGGAGLI